MGAAPPRLRLALDRHVTPKTGVYATRPLLSPSARSCNVQRTWSPISPINSAAVVDFFAHLSAAFLRSGRSSSPASGQTAKSGSDIVPNVLACRRP
ncbi:hypothetical protein Zmor_022571 [Zophobas morio]|uniref:Uncharacterized protein n=1 Tax=Zophobas morio TaxID=2755281 RepID=A0AA38M5H7_9CUCU|nr:hypothetical protein Zmor_022571 [Zophobas morio]